MKSATATYARCQAWTQSLCFLVHRRYYSILGHHSLLFLEVPTLPGPVPSLQLVHNQPANGSNAYSSCSCCQPWHLRHSPGCGLYLNYAWHFQIVHVPEVIGVLNMCSLISETSIHADLLTYLSVFPDYNLDTQLEHVVANKPTEFAKYGLLGGKATNQPPFGC